MNAKKLWFSALSCLIFTVLWLTLMILSASKTGSISTFEQAIDFVMKAGILFQLSYINAVFVTVTITIFFTCLYYYYKPLHAEWSLIGYVFIPIYSVLNLLVYFSQISVVSRLITLMNTSKYPEVYRVVLGQFVQGWSGSTISVVNQLAYAILAIPSIIFGTLLIKEKKISTLGGWLFTLNGLSCIVGVVGTAINNQVLAVGSVLGGALFLFALIVIVLKMKLKE